MTVTATRTNTFTVVDVRKVIDNFAADYSMIGQSTGLRSRGIVDRDVTDLKVFAESKYLLALYLLLKDANGVELRGARYQVSESATGWQSQRPGNNLWPKTAGGSLSIVATLSNAWWILSEADRDAFKKRNGMEGRWGTSSVDTSFSSLSTVQAQRYASNGYGLERTNYV